jgi:glycosyltransferase involved in cell wall biosynthesis
MAGKMTVSVILPVYNAEEFVQEAVESVLDQTYQDFELLIADDGSRDGTGEVLKNLAGQDSRIRLYLYRENKGQAYRLNQLLRKAKGELVAPMDADDKIMPSKLEGAVNELVRDPGLAIIGGQIEIGGDRASEAKKKKFPIDEFSVRFCGCLNNPFSHPAVVFRKRAVEEVGGYRGGKYEIIEDYDLWSRVVYRYKARNLNKVVVWVRKHGRSKSQAGGVMMAQRKLALEIARRNLERWVGYWSEKDKERLFRFLKHHPNDLEEVIEGWRLYRMWVARFFETYPGARRSLSFWVFLTKVTLGLLGIKFSIIPWGDKIRFLGSLLY